MIKDIMVNAGVFWFQVEAEIFGSFGVHQNIDGSGDWCLTHLATGASVSVLNEKTVLELSENGLLLEPTREDVLRLAEALNAAASADDWDGVTRDPATQHFMKMRRVFIDTYKSLQVRP